MGEFIVDGGGKCGNRGSRRGIGRYSKKGKSCLVGKLIAGRVVSKDITRSTLVRGWKPMGTISFKVLGENLFLVEFEYVWDKTCVLEGRPWIFEGNLLSLEEFNGLIPQT